MKSRRFHPVGVDALEDRLVLTAFQTPFTLITPPASEVNPKFLNLTGRTQKQIGHAISAAFDHFGDAYAQNLQRYNDGIARPGADQSRLLTQFQNRTNRALNQLASDLLGVSGKLPFGRVNLYPVLQNRVVGTAGVTDTTTLVNTPSLQQKLTSLLGNDPTGAAAKQAIDATETLVRSDVGDYTNQGVTFGFFRLTRGATFPPLSTRA